MDTVCPREREGERTANAITHPMQYCGKFCTKGYNPVGILLLDVQSYLQSLLGVGNGLGVETFYVLGEIKMA